MDEKVVDEEAAVLDHPSHDWMIHVDCCVVILLDVLSEHSDLTEQSAMETFNASLALRAVCWCKNAL